MSSFSTYRGSEFLASGVSHDFLRFVKKVSDSKSKAEERDHIMSEIESVKSKIGLPDVSSSRMKQYLMRLIHAHMMGYNVDFGLIYAIMITQSGETAVDRRVGYIASALFIGNDNELTIMLTNTMEFLGFAELQFSRPVRRTDSDMQYQAPRDYGSCKTVRKKAYAALYSLYQVDPQLEEQIIPIMEKGLVDKDPSVIGAVIGLWKQLIQKIPTLYEDVLPAVFEHLRNIIAGKLHKSFDYHLTPSPWIQLHCLEILETVQDADLGSASDNLDLTIEVLHAAEKGVDAAYGENLDFGSVKKFVTAQNHIMKYLGLRCLALMNEEVWDEQLRDGIIISDAIAVSRGDETLADEAMMLIENIADSDMLFRISENCLKAISDTQLHKTAVHQRLCQWYIKQIEKHCTLSDGYLELILKVIVESGTSLPEADVEEYCLQFSSALHDDMDNTKFRVAATDFCYKVLKRKSSMTLPVPLLKLVIKTLGENTHIIETEAIDIISQLEKWLSIVEDDDDLIVFIIIVLHDCIARERICTKSLISQMKRYRRSSIHEVQEACYQFLELSQTLTRDQILDTNPDYQYWDQPIMANRDRPSNNRYPVQSQDIEARNHPLARNFYSSQSSRSSSSGTANNQGTSPRHHHLGRQRKSDYSSSRRSSYDIHDPNDSNKEILYDRSDIMSSLIDIEQSGSRSPSSYSQKAASSTVRPLKISTSQFGKLWLALPENELKFQPANVFVTTMAKVAESILDDTGLWPIELIGEELIAAGDLANKRPVLAHLRITESGDIECTVRSTRQVDSITRAYQGSVHHLKIPLQ
ncbi:hypothetical protein INT43_002186 [Umbelopsis isabellina]|uniref:AP-4 complex subunit epsilon-1 C-terminal domain-containing protein n=1 Tax=Mortierella isabellina TaxID=91625 RepID=A0A8H7UH98_MORIS|nr:hypothetical protein INT43_002186 [Umbelopsis isabellina]